MKSSTTLAALAGGACIFAAGLALGQGRAGPPPIGADDYTAIQQLYAKFNTAIDTSQPDRYVETWTDDGVFIGGHAPGVAMRAPVEGRAALYQMAAHGGIGTRHFTANLVVTPTPDGATATSYLVLLDDRTSPPHVVETAIYQDILVKTAEGWKFKRRVNWRDDDPASPFRPKPSSVVLK